MRVLHLDSGKEMRGGQWQVLRLIEGLAAEGVESTLLARPGSPLAGARVSGAISLFRIARLARRHDLVHAHDSRSHTLAALAGGAPLIISRRVTFGGAGPQPVFSRWKYGRARAYIAVSEFVRKSLIERGVPAEKIEVVYDAVPLLQTKTGREACPTVLAPAWDDPLKGGALLMEAAKLAGVELTFSDNLERDLPGAAMLVYITRSEGLGSGALLALSAGVPVVASKIGGLPEIVRHGETGLLVDNEPRSIADAIRGLVAAPALARRMGRTGRRMVEEGFTVAHMVRSTMEVYRKALA